MTNREIDAIIVNKLFGWTKEESVKAPMYSEDIACAWQIVKHYKRHGWEIELVVDNDEAIAILTKGGLSYLKVSDTAEKAICLVTLKNLEDVYGI